MKLELYAARYGTKADLLELQYSDISVLVLSVMPAELRCRVKSIGPSWTDRHNQKTVEIRFEKGTFHVSESSPDVIVPCWMSECGSMRLMAWQIKNYAKTGIWIEPREGHCSNAISFRTPHSKTERIEMFFLVAAAPIIFPTVVAFDAVRKRVDYVLGRAKSALKRALETRARPRGRAPRGRGAGRGAPGGRRGDRRRTWHDIK